MPTQKMYLDDAYVKEGIGIATKVEFTDLVVDKTVFVPTGDGQPNDRGEVVIDGKKYVIADAWYDGDSIHLMSQYDSYPSDTVGKQVDQLIDWNARYLHMKFRTALFLLQGIAYRDFSSLCRINQTYDDSAWIDVYNDDLTEEVVNALLNKANEIVSSGLDVQTHLVSRDEFKASEQLMKVSKGQVPDAEMIRVTKIGDLPEFPDSGTQVKNTSEIGKISAKTSTTKGKLNIRLSITLS